MSQQKFKTSLLKSVPAKLWVTGTQSTCTFVTAVPLPPPAAPNCLYPILCSALSFNAGREENENTQELKHNYICPQGQKGQINLLKETQNLATSKQSFRNNNFIESFSKEVTKMTIVSTELYYDCTCTMCVLWRHLAFFFFLL